MEDIAKFCINYLEKKNCEYVEARIEEKNVNGFVLKNGIPEMSGFDFVQGMGIRFLFNKTLGFVSLNNFDKNNIKINLDRALNITKKAGKISENTELSSEKSVVKKYKVEQKIKLESVNAEKKLKFLKEIFDNIKDKNLIGSFLSYNDEICKKIYINNHGSKIISEIPRVNYSYYITIKKGSETAQGYWQYGATGGWEKVKEWDLNKIMINEKKILLDNLKKGIKVPKEKLDLVVGPEVVGIMVHESCGHPCEADRIMGRESAQAGESFITKDMIGHVIGSKIVSIADEPAIKGTYGYFLYDDEGVETGKNFLYKDGKIKGFLHNRETSKLMGIKSNGCARASDYDKETIVRMSNTYLMKGDRKKDELIKEIKKGIYMKSFTEWNIDDKRWQQKYVGKESYLIENGEITKIIKNPGIEITTPKLWKSVDAIAKDDFEFHAGTCGKGEPMQGIPVTFGGPSMRLRGIKFS